MYWNGPSGGAPTLVMIRNQTLQRSSVWIFGSQMVSISRTLQHPHVSTDLTCYLFMISTPGSAVRTKRFNFNSKNYPVSHIFFTNKHLKSVARISIQPPLL
ncbi:hypothetical protein ILYODFUR_013527 [Ilyodon furcidens]|uniref:Uncharacterized protein n=1 Tax=Ilyodon furcidens TaxID=33524 RepID=A0ABV0SNE1_9TELE